ncbi:MAG: TIGR02186 family protein [Gemmatimonadetes bacterium]|nr:TIGR02186 family protein [Gemmatimonadota bacterium]
MRAVFRLLAPTFVVAVALVLSGEASEAQESLVIQPSVVNVHMLYHESTVHVTAPVLADDEVAILLVGQERSLTLKRKGKVLGLIWMNVGDVTFETVPDVYLLRTTCALSSLAAPAVLTRLDLGFDALAARSGGGATADTLFDELVQLKERDGLWDVSEGRVEVMPAGAEGGALATADFALPAKVPPGEYRVLAYTFARGNAELVGEGSVRVEQGGVAALITALAGGHSLLYGVLAVLIAGAAGLLTGVVFGRGARKGH